MVEDGGSRTKVPSYSDRTPENRTSGGSISQIPTFRFSDGDPVLLETIRKEIVALMHMLILYLSVLFCPPFNGEPVVCSWYGGGFNGRQTANGEIYDMHEMTCAHRTLPFNTRVQFVNTTTGRTAILKVNDRGPFIEGRDYDLSKVGFKILAVGGTRTGVERGSLLATVIDEQDERTEGYIHPEAGKDTQTVRPLRPANSTVFRW